MKEIEIRIIEDSGYAYLYNGDTNIGHVFPCNKIWLFRNRPSAESGSSRISYDDALSKLIHNIDLNLRLWGFEAKFIKN